MINAPCQKRLWPPLKGLFGRGPLACGMFIPVTTCVPSDSPSINSVVIPSEKDQKD